MSVAVRELTGGIETKDGRRFSLLDLSKLHKHFASPLYIHTANFRRMVKVGGGTGKR